MAKKTYYCRKYPSLTLVVSSHGNDDKEKPLSVVFHQGLVEVSNPDAQKHIEEHELYVSGVIVDHEEHLESVAQAEYDAVAEQAKKIGYALVPLYK